MSVPPSPQRAWWVRPRVVLPVVGSLLLLLALLTPEADDPREGDSRLSAHLAGPLGARGLKEAAERLGWRVVLRDAGPIPTVAPGATIHAVLDPALPVSPGQVHRYLEAVRGGDALLLVIGDEGAFNDSLRVRHSTAGGVLDVQQADSAGCGRRGRDASPMLWLDGQVHLYALRWPRGRPAGASPFAHVVIERPREAARQESVAGFPYGRGRIAVVADPDLLRNQVIRRCEWGTDVVAIRMLEWLSAGATAPRRTIEFDEYHQGYGRTASVTGFTRRFLVGHPFGRMLLQLTLGALLLMLALGPRPLRPRPRPRAERRDPLEQVDALAHAYEQVRATRTVTVRLLQGVRARVEHAHCRGRGRSDDAFLDDAVSMDEARAADVALVRRALRSADERIELPDVGAALHRIETSLTSTSILRA